MDPRLLEEYHTLNTIIERDKAVTSFKYALLRGTIEICQQYSHMAQPAEESGEGRISYPLGLLIERWILYYYPIFEHDQFIPQLNGERNLSEPSNKILFRRDFTDIIDYYRMYGGFSAFYSDFRRGNIPDELQPIMRELVRKVRVAITDGPIQHLGYSHIGKTYAVFDWDRNRFNLPKNEKITPEHLIRHAGSFSFHRDLESLFKFFGSFIIGEGTLVSKWADFTVKISKAQGQQVGKDQLLAILSKTPDTTRHVQEASRFYNQLLADTGEIFCIWSNKPIKTHDQLHIDHLLPFSLWKNNDFWNLIPAQATVNKQKRDAIPSPDLLWKREDAILHNWDLISQSYRQTFHQELTTALIGREIDDEREMRRTAFNNLIEKSRYLIEIRGYAAWNPTKASIQ